MCDVFFVHVGDFAVVTFTVLLPCPQPAALCATLPMYADLYRFHDGFKGIWSHHFPFQCEYRGKYSIGEWRRKEKCSLELCVREPRGGWGVYCAHCMGSLDKRSQCCGTLCARWD
jgi:hypothetical protein